MKKDKKNYHHGGLKKALIEAGLRILKTEGFRNLSLRKVAAMAEVSVAAPYRHFRNNEELLAEIAAEGFRMLKTELEKSRELFPGKVLKQFQECGIAYVQFASDNEELFRIMYGNTVGDYSDYPVLKTAADETVMIMQSVIEECQKKKLIRKADPKELAMSAWVLVHGLSTLIIERKFHFSQWNPANLRTEVLRLQKNFYSGIRNRR